MVSRKKTGCDHDNATTPYCPNCGEGLSGIAEGEKLKRYLELNLTRARNNFDNSFANSLAEEVQNDPRRLRSAKSDLERCGGLLDQWKERVGWVAKQLKESERAYYEKQ